MSMIDIIIIYSIIGSSLVLTFFSYKKWQPKIEEDLKRRKIDIERDNVRL
jgi:hypothetical protein